MQLKPGARLRSATDATELVVVRAPDEPVDLRCGGHAMRAAGDDDGSALAVQPGFDGGTQLGKRYAHDPSGLEVLCTKQGEGSISVGDSVLQVQGAKALPSSD